MADAPAELRARVGVALVWVGAIVLALSLPATFGWGLRVEFAGLRLSVFNPGRPQALGFLIGALGLWLLGATAVRVRFARPLALAGRIAGRGAQLAVTLALAVALFAVRYGGHIAGGSDPSGTIGSLFALDRLLPNLARYPWSLIDSHFALLVLAGLGPLAIQNGLLSPSLEISRAARIAWSGPALFAALLGFCSLYLVFDEWLYVRFLLPMLPMLVALAAAALAAGLRRVPDSLSGLALLVTGALIVGGGLGRTVRLGATALRLSEARYVEAARFVEALPPDSVCLAMLHSGSLAYYTARPILRWDWIEAPETDRAVDALRAAGHAVYLVLDNLEEPRFRARFAGTRTVAALGRPLLTTTTPNIRAVVYRLSE